jgi:hypothetical protein
MRFVYRNEISMSKKTKFSTYQVLGGPGILILLVYTQNLNHLPFGILRL